MSAEKQLSRRDAKALTKRRLIEGAIELARAEGLAALTTGRIAAAAGLAQSSFYVHFPDRAACLREMGDAIGAQMLHRIRTARVDFFAQLSHGDLYASNRAFHGSIIEALLQDRELIEVFLKLRREVSSPAGAGLRQLELRARQEVVADMERIGLDRYFGDELVVFLDATVGMIFGVVEGIVDGRSPSQALGIEMVAKMTYPVFSEVVRRMLDDGFAGLRHSG